MLELLVDDERHLAAELLVFDVREDEIQRRAGRFLLAMGVVDEDVVEMGVDLGEPAGGGFGLEVEHGSSSVVSCPLIVLISGQVFADAAGDAVEERDGHQAFEPPVPALVGAQDDVELAAVGGVEGGGGDCGRIELRLADVRFGELAELGAVERGAFEESRGHRAGADDRDADAARFQFAVERFGEGDDGGLREIVRRHAGRANEGEAGRDVDDRRLDCDFCIFGEPRHERVAAVEDAVEIEPEQAFGFARGRARRRSRRRTCRRC